MTMKLYSEEYIQAIADKIREKDGDAALMTVAQMPARIGSLILPTERECIVEKPLDAPNTMYIDTGVAGNINHIIVVTCRAFPGKMAAPFNSSTASANRQGFNILSESKRLQVYWGGWSNMNVDLSATEIDLNQNFTVTQSKTGISVEQGTKTPYNLGYSATGSGSTETYKIFNYARNADIHHGFFKEAKVYDGALEASKLLHHFVIVVNTAWQAFLLDKVTGARTAIAPGFLCHIENQ